MPSSTNVDGSPSTTLTAILAALPPSLKKFELATSNITGVKSLIVDPRLHTLHLYTRVNDISALAGLRALQKFDISAARVTDISALGNLKQLPTFKRSGMTLSDIRPLAAPQKIGALTFNC